MGALFVRGDGSPEEKAALLDLLRENGSNEEDAAGIAEILLSQGLTLVGEGGTDVAGKTMPGKTFAAFADLLTNTN